MKALILSIDDSNIKNKDIFLSSLKTEIENMSHINEQQLLSVIDTIINNNEKEYIKLLRTGILKFKYKKRDNSIRTALGTLNSTLIPLDKFISNITTSNKSQIYYDLECHEWRSFRHDSFIDILGTIS